MQAGPGFAFAAGPCLCPLPWHVRRPAATPVAWPQATKLNLRGDYAREWEAYMVGEVDGAWELLVSPAVTATLGAVLERLSGGKRGRSRL